MNTGNESDGARYEVRQSNRKDECEQFAAALSTPTLRLCVLFDFTTRNDAMTRGVTIDGWLTSKLNFHHKASRWRPIRHLVPARTLPPI